MAINKINQWVRKQPPVKQLAISFISNWLFWLISWLLAEQFFFEETRSWKYHFFHATWMSFFMTIPFNWKLIKKLFQSQNKDSIKSSV